jgi:hypothetical protein
VPRAETSESRYFSVVVVVNSQDVYYVERVRKFYFIKSRRRSSLVMGRRMFLM